MFTKNKSYFIRTVTYHLVGKVAKIDGNFMMLKDASWVADSVPRDLQIIVEPTSGLVAGHPAQITGGAKP